MVADSEEHSEEHLEGRLGEHSEEVEGVLKGRMKRVGAGAGRMVSADYAQKRFSQLEQLLMQQRFR